MRKLKNGKIVEDGITNDTVDNLNLWNGWYVYNMFMNKKGNAPL